VNEEMLRQLYLDLIKRCLTGLIYEDIPQGGNVIGNNIVATSRFVRKLREVGRDFPSQAHSAIGLRRMQNIQRCVESVLANNVAGDLMETGIWRGGACILMRAVLKAYGVTDRIVWAADSFQGLPKPDLAVYPQDKNLEQFTGWLAISLEEVQRNFSLYGLLDDQVHFLKGWFRDTLPVAPVKQLAVLRLDGDLYESTMIALDHLYPKLSPGGFLIIDDWNVPEAQHAVHDYRSAHGISEEIQNIDGWGVFWQREH
jgi:hypothetical protein